MAIEIPKPKKGSLGYVLDMRKAMREVELTAGKWCVAFDKGDMRAVESLGTLLGEHMADLSEAAASLTIASGGDQ